MEFSLTHSQQELLESAARTHPDAHVRSRALAVRAVSLGFSRREVADMFPYSAYSIGQWCAAFAQGGLTALGIAEGRGRHSHVDENEVLACLRQSPAKYGIDQTRWTLHALGQACPSLSDMTERGIQKVLNRLGFHYKRGQPWIHSPDPLYAQKKTPSNKPMRKRSKTQRS
jgi:transposase